MLKFRFCLKTSEEHCYIDMICTLLHTFVTTVLVLVVLVGMVTLLLGVNRMFHTGIEERERDDAERLKKDLESEDNVITPHSVFHPFLGRESPRMNQRRHCQSRIRK